MAAYAAVTSLQYTIHQIQHHHSPPISLDQHQVESLTGNITFFQRFLEGYVSPVADTDEPDPLELRIAEAAYAAEDVIESYLVDNIHLVEGTSCVHFYQDLEIATEGMDLIKAEVMAMDVAIPLRRRNVAVVSGNAGAGTGEMVGLDDVLLHLLERLAGGGRSDRQIIPIVGMGGIGKTTLARNVFEHAFVKEHFDICVWATISQIYNIQETFREVLSQAKGHCSGESVSELGEALHKQLAGRRYLVVMDDMWSLEVWDKTRIFFPDYNNGSRVLVTTRLSDLAACLAGSNRLDMTFLDEASSWTLFSKTVFGEESFPDELEEIGKKIVEKSSGLPLSIVVIGGLLAKSQRTQEYWEHVEDNLKSILSSERGGDCLSILKMSYNHLPAYLKPCFLYMGVFKEDSIISVPAIIKLWVSEGFLEPVDYKDMETVAGEYLKELVDRNLVLVHQLGLLGNLEDCKMHDLLRDLALQEAQKQRFYYVFGQYDPWGINNQRRIVIPYNTSEAEVLGSLKSMARVRSYLCFSYIVQQLPESRLMRTMFTCDGRYSFAYGHSLEHVFRLVNSRYLETKFYHSDVLPPIKLLWNLYTLIVHSQIKFIAPIEIWKMRQLRHVEFAYGLLYLLDPPPSNDNDILILENLQVLKGVQDFYLNEEVVRRIPNIKKLKINYSKYMTERAMCLSYLQCLSKLETFHCEGRCHEYLRSITFPNSLTGLFLQTSYDSDFEVDDILDTISSLPHLHKLRLGRASFRTGKWEIIQGQFQRLRFLYLYECDLQEWTVLESSCFPLLHVIYLERLERLNEIPPEIGQIPTIKFICVNHCSESAVLSAKKIVEEQEDLQGEQLDFHVRAVVEDIALESLASPNFEVEYF